MRKLILSALVALTCASSAAFAAAGGPDPSFGNGGTVITNFNQDVRPSAAVLQSNGDIVVAATIGDAPTSAALVRYLPNGALDTSFGSGGVVMEMFQNQVNSTGGVAVQPNGKIILQAVAANTSGSIVESLLVRFNSNGTLDNSFANAGQLVLSYPAPPPYSASPIGVLLEPNGDFLVLFSLTPPFRNHSPVLTALARYTPSGTLDPTFGSGGQSAAVALGSAPTAMALFANGKTLVVTSPTQTAEFNSVGGLLPTVTPGMVVAGTLANPIFLPNSDYLVLAGAQGPGGRRDIDSEVVRFLSNGTLDPTFQSPLFDFSQGNQLPSIAEAIALAPSGQIVVSGEATDQQNNSLGFGVARLNANGSMDTTFGNAGIVITTFPRGGQALAVLAQPDGKVLAVGQEFRTSDFINLAVVRYLGH